MDENSTDDMRSNIIEICHKSFARTNFPDFLFTRLKFHGTPAKRFWFWLLQLPIRALIWIALRPRLETPGSLDQAEVDRVYTRQADRYNRTHHFTTRGQDTSWRRWIGWQIAARGTESHVLDLCTGTGLTISEMLRVSRQTNTSLDIVGLDYNDAMLNVARESLASSRTCSQGSSIRFCRGDATNLIGKTDENFERFQPETFDVVSQMFGIGGIGKPMKVFDGVLRVLREGGTYYLVDMHQPVSHIPGEWPFFGAWLKTPNFEAYTYLTTTMPLALARLWAWRDTTLDFYLAPLICYEENGLKWGFKVVSRVYEPERWWLGLPVMPTCKLVLEKVKISDLEYEERQELLASFTAENRQSHRFDDKRERSTQAWCRRGVGRN